MSPAKIVRNFDGEYSALGRFAHEHRNISYDDFDRAVLEEINLFIVPKDETFFELESALDKIIATLPAIKRIFTKPITRLSDTNNVLPVEAAKVINNQSMVYISQHSENWGDIKNGELYPKKLMTIERIEDYATYENIIFVRFIDFILSYVKRNFRLLKDIMYANRELSFNLLESTNHVNYFLALGKLHIGYIRGREIDNAAYERCLDKLWLIDRTIRSKLNSHIYLTCRKKKTVDKLKRTNVFRLQKDYKQIYSLIRWFGDRHDTDELRWMSSEDSESYPEYCAILSVFALAHLNFDFSNNSIDFVDAKAKASFLEWSFDMCSLRGEGIEGLLLSFSKERSYRICLIFGREGDMSVSELEKFQKENQAEEYLFVSSTEYGKKNSIYLSLFDVDSFRRVQQLAIRAMIYCDEKREVCLFCGHELTRDETTCYCKKCRTLIEEKTCDTDGGKYFVSGIYDYKPKMQNRVIHRDRFLTEKFTESQMFFRNITSINAGGENICPRCGKIHKDQLK
ncbi:MAG: DUF2357 domain-containing protein [Clostridia bacterium]|nr:DUF2357 domain-containing protein [Clostridia bacterium]